MSALMTAPPLLHADAGSGRIRRTVPAGASSALVAHLICAAMRPDWSPFETSADVVRRAHGDVALLRQARLRLRQSTRFRTTLAEARALATVNLAISSLEDAANAE